MLDRIALSQIFAASPPEVSMICRLILEDLTYAQIGEQLGISERAVEGHMHRSVSSRSPTTSGRACATTPKMSSNAAEAAEPDQDRLRARGRSMAGVLGRVGTAATGGTIAQLLGHAMLIAMGVG